MLNINSEQNITKILMGTRLNSEVISNDTQFFPTYLKSFLFLASCDQDSFQDKVSANIVRVLGSTDICETENDLEQRVSGRLSKVPA